MSERESHGGVAGLLRYRGFVGYLTGIVLSQIGVRATLAANLYHVYQISGSTAQVGLVGLSQALAVLFVSPLGGYFADRFDRKRLLQYAQATSMLASLGLAVLTVNGSIAIWHIFVAVLINTAASTFDGPARNSLIAALLPRERFADGFAMLMPAREMAVLVGPAAAGLLIAVYGPAVVYALDAATYVILIGVLATLRVKQDITPGSTSIITSLREGVSHIRGRPVIWQLLALDLSATFFGAYRVILPELSLDVLDVGATGYGLLASAPSVGALLGTTIIFKLIKRGRAGRLVLGATISYGVACAGLAQAPTFALALVAGAALGGSDALASAIRAAAVQIETPDHIRGRVTAFQQMALRGGPALGQLQIGMLAGVVGPAVALTAGAAVPVAHAGLLWARGHTLRWYRIETTPA